MPDVKEPTHADLAERLDRIEKTLEPIADTWEDVAALGRSGRIVGRFILWTAGMVVAVMAAWNQLDGLFG